jgi:hypothetical protein
MFEKMLKKRKMSGSWVQEVMLVRRLEANNVKRRER